MENKIAIVTGGRNYSFPDKVFEALNLFSPTHVVNGGAKGADQHARLWCTVNKISNHTMDPRWDLHGKAAGPIRNQCMIDLYPTATLIAFPGGRGTKDCVNRAIKAGMTIIHVKG